MGLPFVPAFHVGESDEFALTKPMFPWEHRRAGIGGSAVAASGVPAAYVIRRDRIVDLTLRVMEGELDALSSILEGIRDSGDPFVFAFDRDDEATEFTVYLVSPAWPDEIESERDDQYRELFTVPISIRRADGEPFGLSWTEVES